MPLYQSRRARYILAISCIFFVLFVCLRLIFYSYFSEVGDTLAVDRDTLLKALSIGVRFDLRLALILALPLFLLAILPYFNLTSSVVIRRLASIYIVLTVAMVGLFYIFDFGHYSYLGTRINVTAMRFIGDAAISSQMVWESYPVIWILVGWLTAIFAVTKIARIISKKTLAMPGRQFSNWQVSLGMAALLIFMVAMMFGRFSQVPLRWNHAYFSGDSAVAALGLNPVLYFYKTVSNHEAKYDLEQVKKYYPVITRYLGVTELDPELLNYDRYMPAADHAVVAPGQRKPNVIFIMLESLGASRVGIYGNPLKPTPNLDNMAENGIWAPHFYVPLSGTARTVFSSITGIPDIVRLSTASRNPMFTDQRVVMNYFTEHDKYYFLGGSAGWANMSAFIQHSVSDIQLFEEDDHTEPVVDVWGISDLSLFKEFDRFMAKRNSDKPFFAIIQTAANHRPFTIPDEGSGFESISLPEKTVNKWGYRSNEQLNAVRLLDFNIGKFMEMAKAGGYFEDTLFVLYGDHNNRITSTPHMAPFHEKVKLDLDGLHVPFIMYSPRYLEPQKLEGAYSLVDVMPTVAGLLGIPYVNTTMGRDMFLPAPEGERAVYVESKVGKPGHHAIGMITENFAVRMHDDYSDPTLHKLFSPTPEQDVKLIYPEKYHQLRELLIAYYETSLFQFYHNRQRDAQQREKATKTLQ